ncbi:hypothetical protein [Nocardia sp. NPDC057353]|uniref:phthiocerol/phthiodiolone dimycocerosyl transferase family protein n=1 Tax=Nocardia sp. NPDC057353 TaxID=3346104 RepID=UPI0036398C09
MLKASAATDPREEQSPLTGSVQIRPLAPSEMYFAHVEYYTGNVAHLSAHPDLEILTRAYETLVSNYPVLKGRIEATATGYSLMAARGTMPPISVLVGDPRRAAGTTTLRQNRSVSGLVVVRGVETASITLFVHHSVADGRHGLTLFGELWTYYTEIAAGRQVAERVRDYPLPVEDLLLARGIDKLAPAEFADPPVSGTLGAPGRIPAGVGSMTAGEPNTSAPQFGLLPADCFEYPQPTRIRLSTAQTATLAALCREEVVTINGLIGGAILLARARIRNARLSELLYCYPVDLRDRVVPPIGGDRGNQRRRHRFLPAGRRQRRGARPGPRDRRDAGRRPLRGHHPAGTAAGCRDTHR